jgi:glutathione synthase/RimK-type ligase-like ATP-grasp enzyme
MILVCGSTTDYVISCLCAVLRDQQLPVRCLDLAKYPVGYHILWKSSGGSVVYRLCCSDWVLTSDDLTGAFVRYSDPIGSQLTDQFSSELQRSIVSEANLALQMVLESSEIPLMNPLTGMLSNQSKPCQALMIRDCGLHVPRSIISTDPAECQQFMDRCGGRVVYKPMYAGVGRVSAFDSADMRKHDWSQNTPLYLQETILGDDIRVHVVGNRCIAVRIRSPELDYHEVAKRDLKMEQAVLPKEVEKKLRNLCRRLHLQLAGIDLKETADGKYYCFEANPCPAFPFYEVSGERKVATAIGRQLSKRRPIASMKMMK